MSIDPVFLNAFDALPVGGYGATAYGRRYRVTKSTYASGRSQKLVAEELGGSDYISMNLYRLATGDALLKPCEMPEDKVRDFVLNVIAD
ncbi:MAG: hypothetical protein HKO95_15750 [Rhodobacteraceae bacterium]|nr:hypothetical protein [Alphaproteobacteria bacterium]MBT8474510.1 hypothetical protein [Alphaproteobacteria bacterium]NNF72817.1 hypothetical protein [Paracoccaceae bacterium]NNK68180.1 hypothetical protein [Paracoccaceae bacterium]